MKKVNNKKKILVMILAFLIALFSTWTTANCQEKAQYFPLWFFEHAADEYAGVSFPLKNKDLAKQQAISTALLSYMVQHELKGNLLITPVNYTGLDDYSDVVAFYAKQIMTVKFNVKENIRYAISKVSENQYGEVFVLIKASPSNNAKDSVVFSWARQSFNDEAIDSHRYYISSDFRMKTSAFAMRMPIYEKDILGNPSQDEQEGYFVDVYLAGRNEANNETYDEKWKWESTIIEDEDFEQNSYLTVLPATYILDNLGVEEKGTAIENCLGKAYYDALLEWFQDGSLWEREQVQAEKRDESGTMHEHFTDGKRKAMPVRLGVKENVLFIQHYKK